MAKDIKLDGPLSEADRAYLAARGRYAEITRADAEFGTEHDDSKLESKSNKTYLQGGTNPEITGEDDPLGEGEDDPYELWSYADLQAELKERQLPAGGKHNELVARLREDDENKMEHPTL